MLTRNSLLEEAGKLSIQRYKSDLFVKKMIDSGDIEWADLDYVNLYAVTGSYILAKKIRRHGDFGALFFSSEAFRYMGKVYRITTEAAKEKYFVTENKIIDIRHKLQTSRTL